MYSQLFTNFGEKVRTKKELIQIQSIPYMQKLDKTAIKFLYLIGIVIGMMMCLRFISFFKWAVMTAVIFAGFALSFYFLMKFLKEIKAERNYRKSVSGTINEQMKYYQKQILDCKKEIESQENDIQDLESKLDNPSLLKRVRLEYGKTINNYKTHKKIQRIKQDFYQLAIDKLKIIKDNHEALETLKEKQTKLKRLQESNLDSLADLEELKSKLELQKDYVEAIDRLSLKMLNSNRLEDAKVLRLELETMTEELDNI